VSYLQNTAGDLSFQRDWSIDARQTPKYDSHSIQNVKEPSHNLVDRQESYEMVACRCKK